MSRLSAGERALAPRAVSMGSNQANRCLLNLVSAQIGEMELVRSKIYQIEQTHRQKMQQYDTCLFLQHTQLD